MLDEIRVENLGLIVDAALTPGPGLTVITGETGTGKTLMLGALRLVRGDKASKDTVGPHAERTEVAARLIPQDGSDIVARRVVTSARSRAYLNGTPAAASELTAVVGPLVSIVAQHDQHTLATSEGTRRIIDAMFTANERRFLEAYRSRYRALQSVEAELESLGSDRRGLERELEMTRFQSAEIDEAGFVEGEEEALRLRLDRLRHTEEITAELSTVMDILGESGMERGMGRALDALDRIARLDIEGEPLSSRLSDVAREVNDLAGELSRFAASLDSDPDALARDEGRLAELSALKRKYGDTISDINAFAKTALERSETITGLLDAAQSLQERHVEAIAALDAAGTELRTVRTKHATAAARGAQGHLRDLGFASPIVDIVIDAKEPSLSGADRFQVLFASDAALTPAPVSAIASGGELSRLVLALTLASGGADVAVVAFDEIDAGIGGTTALAMGHKLASLARTRQVICVTHLPQVAAYASCHYRVMRDGATATVQRVTDASRIEEISRMLAGMGDSEKGKRHAEELLMLASESATSGTRA